MAVSDYRCPPLFTSNGEYTKDDMKMGWLREALQQGRAYLEAQRSYEDMRKAVDMISGPHEERIPKARSRIYVNRLKRQIREVVATLANIRPLWGYKTDNEEEYGPQAEILNKLLYGWWTGTFADRRIREAIQYACVLGTGYVSPIWERDFWFAGRGDVALHVYGPGEVIPVQMPRDHDLQKAYAVILCTEVPIAQAHAMYPEYADLIKPSRERPGWIRKGIQKIQRYMGPALNVGGPRSRETEEAIFPVVDIYHTYIMDLSINQTGGRIPMGTPGTNWAYEVPYVGEDILTGTFDSGGRALYRKATNADAMMYPQRRLMISTDKVVLNPRDDASPWWHGKVPVVKFTADDWPWEALGFSLARDGHAIQEGNVELLRQIQDSGNARLRPSLQYDGNIVTQATMDRLDTRAPGQHLDVNTSMGEFVRPILPADYYEVPSWIPGHIQSMEQRSDWLIGLPDMASIAKAGQLPSADSLEKMVQMAGPLIQDMSRTMEQPLGQLGELFKGLAFQWMDARRRIPLLGKSGTTKADWYDFDPTTFVPATLPGNNRKDRARYLMSQMVFHIDPNTAHQITQMSQKLMFLQLFTRGFPIDPWTLGEALDIPNFGSAPDGATTVYDRWKAWMLDRAQVAQAIQLLASMGMAGGMPGSEGNPPGRPPSFNEPPRMETKDGGTRATISTSR